LSLPELTEIPAKPHLNPRLALLALAFPFFKVYKALRCLLIQTLKSIGLANFEENKKWAEQASVGIYRSTYPSAKPRRKKSIPVKPHQKACGTSDSRHLCENKAVIPVFSWL
jgi:hypothetical protein